MEKDRAKIQPPVHEAETQGFEALLASTETGSTGIGEDVVVEVTSFNNMVTKALKGYQAGARNREPGRPIKGRHGNGKHYGH